MSTAVSRLYEATRRGMAPVDTRLDMSFADGLEISRLIETLCPHEEACEIDGTRVCDSCGIGEAHPCPNRFVVCVNCRGVCCNECANEIRDEREDA